MPLPRLSVLNEGSKRVDLADHSFLMLDPSICRCGGLFRDIRKKDQAHQSAVPMELEYTGAPEHLIEFHSGALLGGFDLAVLQAVLSIGRKAASECLITDTSSNSSIVEAELLSRLRIEPVAAPAALEGSSASFAFGFPIQELLQIAGLQENGRNSLAARHSIQRFECVTMTVRAKNGGPEVQTMRLLTVHFPEKSADRGFRAWVALNPRLLAFLLRKERQHVRISLDEARRLRENHGARVLHQRLSAVVDDDDERPLTMSTLIGYLYPDDTFSNVFEEVRANAVASFARLKAQPRKLLQTKLDATISAMEQIQDLLHWEVELMQKRTHALDALWMIRRPKVNHTKHELRLLRELKGSV